VIGTRPEAIKLAPVAHALAERGLRPKLLLTGQHPTLDPRDFGAGAFAVERLDCPGQDNPHRHVRAVTERLLPRLEAPPDLVIVQGDTSSALGAALAAFTAGVPVGHVEAGLRTHDPLLPWPEEEYRTAIDAGADLLFAPTPLSAANLQAEQVPGEIHVTGNTAIDALMATVAELPPASLREQRSPPVILVTCHRRESWGEGLRSIAAAIAELAHDAHVQLILHPNPRVGTQMRRLLAGLASVSLLQPCSHRQLLALVRDADLVLSDSGGLQEEAPTLGVPLLVLREKTERPEGIASGNARLVGTGTERIVNEARRLLGDPVARAAMSRQSFPYGDGRAAARIAAIAEAWLDSANSSVVSQRHASEKS
jgi:UDP-N-acetylglucosamine 2-epimerase (non-hydrolysing)